MMVVQQVNSFRDAKLMQNWIKMELSVWNILLKNQLKAM